MAWVTLSLGSNINAEANILRCLDRLQAEFGELVLSQVFESEAVGFQGDNFLNMAVALETDLPLAPLSNLLKRIEDENGRDRNQPRFCGRPLDIDILTYDDLTGVFDGIRLPRPEITENAFVLWPLSQIAGDRVHPPTGLCYLDLWASYEKQRQKLWPVDFQWQGKVVSES